MASKIDHIEATLLNGKEIDKFLARSVREFGGPRTKRAVQFFLRREIRRAAPVLKARTPVVTGGLRRSIRPRNRRRHASDGAAQVVGVILGWTARHGEPRSPRQGQFLAAEYGNTYMEAFAPVLLKTFYEFVPTWKATVNAFIRPYVERRLKTVARMTSSSKWRGKY